MSDRSETNNNSGSGASTNAGTQSSGSPIYTRKSSGLIRSISARNALLANLVGMGILVNIWWVVYASALYPSADLPATVLFGLILSLLIAVVYWMLATAMPRTGGDYIYVSRIIHPAIGFMTNAMFVAVMITWAGLFVSLTVGQALQIMFANLHQVTGVAYYGNVASWLQTPNAEFGVGAVIDACIILLMLLPVKWLFRVIVGMFAVQAVIYAWFIGTLATVSNSTFVANFAQSGTTVQNILNAATSSGVVWKITLAGSLIGVVYTMLSFIGYANSAYFAGEVKGNPGRSQGLAIAVTPVVFAVLIYILYAMIYNVFGHDFLVASASLATSAPGTSAYSSWWNTLAAMPSPAYLVSFISKNTWFVAAVPFGLALTFLGFAIVYFFIPIRNIFAWAFDRIVPTRLATVSRTGVPWVAILVYGVIVYISLYISVYTTIFNYFAYSNFGWFIAVAIVMFSAAIFPYRRKDLFESSPGLVKRKVGKVPLITIVGVIGGVLSAYVSYATILPAYTGFALNPTYVVCLLLVFVIAIVIYVASYYYHKRKGLPLSIVSKELPPT